MNRPRWIALAAVAAVVVLVVGGAIAWNAGRAGVPAAPVAREAFGFDAAYADPDAKVIIVRYGDSSSCPSKDIRHTVVQKPDRVIVTLTRERMPTDRFCTLNYGARLVRISLSTRVSNRTIIDGSHGTPVTVSQGVPPFG